MHGPLRSRRLQTGGRPATAYYLNEHQAVDVALLSRTPKARLATKTSLDLSRSAPGKRGSASVNLPRDTASRRLRAC
jgi:hypothetical protein